MQFIKATDTWWLSLFESRTVLHNSLLSLLQLYILIYLTRKEMFSLKDIIRFCYYATRGKPLVIDKINCKA